MIDEDSLEREVLDSWSVPPPTEGFADRVLARRKADADPQEAAVRQLAGTRRWPRAAMAAMAVTALASVGLFVSRSSAQSSQGSVLTTARRSVALGHRGVAVAEARSSLQWRVDEDGDARLLQEAGDIFYRVEKGGAFRVSTPAGEVRVTGTCFRIEVKDMAKNRHLATSAALGALAVVTVYEGSVLFSGTSDAEPIEVVAGQKAVAGPDGVSTGAQLEAPAGLETDDPAGAGPDLSRGELLERDRAQRAEIASLRSKLREREGTRVARAAGAGTGGQEPDGRPWFDPGEDTLKAFAAECRVRFDLPPIQGVTPRELSADEASALGLSQSERAKANRALAAMHARFVEEVRALYIEATGDEAGADVLSPSAMGSEIRDKSLPGERGRVQQQIARERAGIAPAPRSLQGTSVAERYMRFLASAGDDLEVLLANELGPERARQLREENGGWGKRMEMAGCPQQDRNEDEDVVAP